jgi:hypothetical protein
MEHAPSPDIIKALSLLGAEIRASAVDLEGIAEASHANGSAWMHRYVEWPDGEFESKKAGPLRFLPSEVVDSGGKTYVTFAYSEERELAYALMPSSSDADPMVFKIDDNGKAKGRVERVVGFIGRLKKVAE